MAELISVEVAYAEPERQMIISLTVNEGTTVEKLIARSGILDQCADIDLSSMKVGIFGKVCRLDKTVSAEDRVEIYRPLQQDPMDARRNRAVKS